VPGGVRKRLLENPVGSLVDAWSEVSRGAIHVDCHLEAGRPMALRQGVECGQAQRRFHLPRRLWRAIVVTQDADELVDFLHGLARDLFDRFQGRSSARRILLAQEAGGTRLDEDDVDRMAGGVVEVTRYARAFLRGGEAALALRLALGPQRTLLELGHVGAAHPNPVANHPRGAPDQRSEQERNGGELVAGESDCADVDDEEAGHGRGGQSRGHARLFGARREEIERDRRPERRPGRIPERVQRGACRSSQSEHGERRPATAGQGQRRERRQRNRQAVETAGVCLGFADGAAPGEEREGEPEDHHRDTCVNQELSTPRHVPSLARPCAHRVSPAGYPDPP
jgi:hypothetical protein